MYREYPKVYNYETLEYSRKSRSDDPLMSLEEVLEKHGKILDEYAKLHLGGSVPEENKFKEVASSETIDGRPEMLRLLKAVESPAIKAIMVVEVQRLSRGDLEDAGRLIKILRYTNTLVITPTKTYDLRDEYDRDAFERELKRGSEYLEYYKKIQHRGKMASLKEGNYLGSIAPYGYDRIVVKEGNKNCHTLKINEEEAEIVRMIFNWYCNDDIGPTMICRRLEKMGIKSKFGHDKWNIYIVNQMLQNVHYIGCVRWNFRKTEITIEDQEIKKSRTPAKNVEEYLVFEGKHEAIITQKQFNKALEIRGKRHRTKSSTKLKNILGTIIYCECGSRMGYNTYVKKGVEYAAPRLKCNNQVHCHNASGSYSEIIDYILKSLEDMIEDFELRVENQEDTSVRLHINLIASLEKRLADLEKKELLQWEAQYDPDESKRLPQHVFQRLNEKLLLEKEEVTKSLCIAKESAPIQVDYKEKILKFTDAIAAVRDPDVSVSIKNKFLKEIIERIEYSRPPSVRYKPKGFATGTKYDHKPFKITIKLK